MQIFSIYYFFDFILTDWIIFYIIIYVVWAYTLLSGCGSVWLERHLREVEAASSNLVTPIELNSTKYRRIMGSAVFLRFGVSTN